MELRGSATAIAIAPSAPISLRHKLQRKELAFSRLSLRRPISLPSHLRHSMMVLRQSASAIAAAPLAPNVLPFKLSENDLSATPIGPLTKCAWPGSQWINRTIWS